MYISQTCHTNKDAKESRIDFILANSFMTPAITKCYVDLESDFPTHRPLIIEVWANLLERTTNELQTPTNYAKLMEEKVQEEIRAEAKKHEDELQSGNDKHEKANDGAISRQVGSRTPAHIL